MQEFHYSCLKVSYLLLKVKRFAVMLYVFSILLAQSVGTCKKDGKFKFHMATDTCMATISLSVILFIVTSCLDGKILSKWIHT